MEQISSIPRCKFACLPTPMHNLYQLSKFLDGPQIYIKRDDLTGIGVGGNKIRKLEFLIADAITQSATDIITQGATQTNHGSQTSAVANKYGLPCHLLLENRCMNKNKEYLQSGNIFLSNLLHTHIYHFDKGTDMIHEMNKLADKLISQGKRPYIIPGGASNALGSLGYVICAKEIAEHPIDIDEVIVCAGSGGTQAGLVAGFHLIESPIKVLGISNNAHQNTQLLKVDRLCNDILALLKEDTGIPSDKLQFNCEYIGTGYGHLDTSTIDAIKMVARQEGLFLDPVYTGVAMAGLIDLIRKGRYTKDQKVLFLLTGGFSSLFAYKTVFNKIL